MENTYKVIVVSEEMNGFLQIEIVINGDNVLNARYNRKNDTDIDLVNRISQDLHTMARIESNNSVYNGGRTLARNFSIPIRHHGTIEIAIDGNLDVSNEDLTELFAQQKCSNGVVTIDRK